jgi:hypothetical protein
LRNVVSDVGLRTFGPKFPCGYPSDAKWKRDVLGNLEQRVGTIHHRRMQRRRHRADADRAASIRFWTAGMTESAGPLPAASAKTMHGAPPRVVPVPEVPS